MLANKLKFVTDKLLSDMPENDSALFKATMYGYIQRIQAGNNGIFQINTGNDKMDKLIAAIINDMKDENLETTMAKAKGKVKVGRGRHDGGYHHGGYNGYYGNNYWYNPWWYNYWYNYWSPYYWWPYYGGYTYVYPGYVGGSKKSGHSHNHGNLLSILDQDMDIHNLNMECQGEDCTLTMSFTKHSYGSMNSTNQLD